MINVFVFRENEIGTKIQRHILIILTLMLIDGLCILDEYALAGLMENHEALSIQLWLLNRKPSMI